ncbi:Crp/Fnr family transcriptional regulator [uncultured Chryseobacterium sp.]|uniref:Crp/Fnr family transcriptional regulator n=1 Tax=uncultured Chryseobacterium sp. TaxID=259322 RepID=UPI0025D33CFF|nr:Crp/Fnr family transcriptional regulator [uncultured Chryseobacterium sp.]
MCISEKLLRSAGAVEQHYRSGNYIFRQDSFPQFYFYILEGDVKLTNYAEDGKEFIQDIIHGKAGIGEAMLILGKVYPVHAIALSDCTFLKLARNQFFQLLQDNPSAFKEIYTALAQSTFEKQTLMHTITSKSAEDRLIEIMDLMKEAQAKKDKFSLEITYTRQQLASLTGLSLETTIRIIKKMEKENTIKLEGRKILY